MRATPSIAFLLATSLAAPAFAADTGITGTKLVIRAHGTTKKLAFVSKDPLAPFPPLGSADDPATGTPGGATVELVVPGGTGTLAVPPGIGTPGWRTHDATLDSYAYKNTSAPAGPSVVRSLGLRQSRQLKVNARDVPIPLDAPLGSVGIRITMGSTRSCALFDASTIVRDAPGDFSARGAVVKPADCSETTLGHPPVCGNGALEDGEQCDGGADAACPGICQSDCTCPPVCGNGVVEGSEQCDGSAFVPGACGSDIPGQAACLPNCACCALELCSATFFDAPCCPGYGCPGRIGPNSVSFCSPVCTTVADCQAGQICAFGLCRTPQCSTDAECAPGFCAGGICCLQIGQQIFCQ
jgi:hypothetical protein